MNKLKAGLLPPAKLGECSVGIFLSDQPHSQDGWYEWFSRHLEIRRHMVIFRIVHPGGNFVSHHPFIPIITPGMDILYIINIHYIISIHSPALTYICHPIPNP